MMSEAGQIFALLRSASAAELAKRFTALDDGAGPPAPQTPAPAAEAVRPGPAPGGAGLPGGGLAGGAAAGGASGGVTAPGETAEVSAQPAPSPGAEGADALAATRPAALRAAFSLASLAPPRADLVRFLAEAAASGLHRMPGAGGAGSAAAGVAGTAGSGPGAMAAEAGRLPGAGGLPGTVPAADAARPGGAGALAPVDSETTTQAFVTQPSVRAGVALAAGLGGLAAMAASQAAAGGADVAGDAAPLRPGLATGSAGAAQLAAAVATGASAADASAAAGPTSGMQPPRGAEAVATAAGATPAPSGDGISAAARTATVAQVAFAEAVIALIDAAGSSRAGSVASGVIFNAAMIPGWPFPSAFAKDGPEGINPKALLHQLATAVEGMSPQEAAEYLARIGGGHVFLRNLRQILMQLDMLDKEDVKGLLFSFLETLSAIATGLEKAFKLMADSAALQAAVVHGEVAEDAGRPGRRRLRL